MKVAVDRDHCIGAGNCAMTAPSVFDQDADEAIVILLTDSPPDSEQDAVQQAVDRCPAAVIRLLP
ncbi:ferredoxin [Paractinoplanes atraurantiacus]|uniref:Ferredoxin n=1 Tax=Paractinoplanes atraurantiacus TaxID=1036182 RepID=A0A285GIT1_9ACTN|nr:ferredoxin [Actinoplanes atraurantiacus]SNY23497.1 ferredoxin [Actinoplanes atraurantiacus]